MTCLTCNDLFSCFDDDLRFLEPNRVLHEGVAFWRISIFWDNYWHRRSGYRVLPTLRAGEEHRCTRYYLRRLWTMDLPLLDDSAIS